MSQQRNDDTPRDWRRRRGRDRQAAGEGDARPPSEADALAEQSRTLLSFVEPAFDFIAVFYAPILIAGVVGLIAGASLLAFVGSLRLYGGIVLGIGAALVLLVAISYFSQVIAAFFSRTGRYGVNTVVMTAAFIGLVVLINYVAFENHFRADTTATNQFSLANRTKDLLDDLDRPINVIAYYPDEIPDIDMLTRRGKVDTMLSEFSKRSGSFNYEFIDPQKEPDLARSQGVTVYETLSVSAVGTGVADLVQPTDAVYSRLEQDLYTALLVATETQRKKVYFLAGHGERDISRSEDDGYQQIRDGLEVDNYAVERLTWSPTEEDVTVPDDAALLVIAGPTGELPPAHADALNCYMEGFHRSDEGRCYTDTGRMAGEPRREGARLIFLAEPDTHNSFRAFLTFWGVVVEEGYIRDVDGSQPNAPRTLRLGIYNPQAPAEIVAPRGQPLNVAFMPGAAALQPVIDDSAARLPVPIAATTQSARLISDIERTDPIDDDPQGIFFPALYLDIVAPVGVPAPTERPPDNQIAGMAVFGDSDFIANRNVQRGSSAALFLNSANYLMGDFSLVSIRDREFVYREWNLDANEFNFVRFSTWLLLPGLMGIMAVVVWWVRR
ncbi:MAG: GldG family protein [Chloroflexota bacterium]|nr:GldG family protein [Chloroflexota bacterium]MDE2684439.1 GldG family protein [Chloroflexota bacterium]